MKIPSTFFLFFPFWLAYGQNPQAYDSIKIFVNGVLRQRFFPAGDFHGYTQAQHTLQTDSIRYAGHTYYIYYSSITPDSVVFTKNSAIPANIRKFIRRGNKKFLTVRATQVFGKNFSTRRAIVNGRHILYIDANVPTHFITDFNLSYNNTDKWWGHVHLQWQNLFRAGEKMTAHYRKNGREKDYFFGTSWPYPGGSPFGLEAHAHVNIRQDSLGKMETGAGIYYALHAWKAGILYAGFSNGTEKKNMWGFLWKYTRMRKFTFWSLTGKQWMEKNLHVKADYLLKHQIHFSGKWLEENTLRGLYSDNRDGWIGLRLNRAFSYLNWRNPDFNLYIQLENKISYRFGTFSAYLKHNFMHTRLWKNPSHYTFFWSPGLAFTKKEQEIALEIRWLYKNMHFTDNQRFAFLIKWRGIW